MRFNLDSFTDIAIDIYRTALLVLAGQAETSTADAVTPPALPQAPSEISFLSVTDVERIHELQMLAISPDEPRGVLNRGQLEAAVLTPRQTFGGRPIYPTVVDMAAAYWAGLVGGHAFQQGNKRVSFLASQLFLWKNGQHINITNASAVEITFSLIVHELDRESLAIRLSSLVKK